MSRSPAAPSYLIEPVTLSFAAGETLRRQGYGGSIVMLSSDDAPPVDRPNLSKDYLAGTAPEEWVPLRPDSYYAENGIDLRLKTAVAGIDVRGREVVVAGGGNIAYDRLLLATGAEPVRLSIPGADQPHVHVLRSLADCRVIIDGAKTATVDTVAAANTNRVIVYDKWMPAGSHTVRVVNLATSDRPRIDLYAILTN